MSKADQSDGEIGAKMDRIREIIARLEDGEVSVERAKELRDEGKELLGEVEAQLDLGEASVIERDGSGADGPATDPPKNDGRTTKVAEAIAGIGYEGITAFDRTEPEYGTIETLFETFDDPTLVELLVVSATTEDYQLNGDAQLFWNELERVALEHGHLESTRDVREILDTFMAADVNARLNQAKRDRLERLFGNEFDEWFLENAETASPVEVWEQLADGLENDRDKKTVVLSMKVLDVARLIRNGHYLDFPSDIPIPCDLQIKRISQTSGLTASDETDQVLDAWTAVMDEVNERLDRPVSVLRVDSIVWQAGQIVGAHEPDRDAAREGLIEHFRTVGLDGQPARILAEELTADM